MAKQKPLTDTEKALYVITTHEKTIAELKAELDECYRATASSKPINMTLRVNKLMLGKLLLAEAHLATMIEAATKVMKGDIKMLPFDEANPLMLGTKVDLSNPETAYLYGWEGAILECGEILAKAKLLATSECKPKGGEDE